MHALKERCSGTASQTAKPVDLPALQERIATVLLEALSFVAPDRIGDSLRDWLARMDLSMLPPAGEAALMAEATAMATTLALFTPSGSGTVAVDRLVRARTQLDPADAAAITVLRQTQFRLVSVLDAGEDGTAMLHDVATGQVLELYEAAIGAGQRRTAPCGLASPVAGRRVLVHRRGHTA